MLFQGRELAPGEWWVVDPLAFLRKCKLQKEDHEISEVLPLYKTTESRKW